MVTGPAAHEAWAGFSRELGHNLRRARVARNLTQEQLVERVGISLYAYQQYERGAVTKDGSPTNPRLATIIAISQALGAELGEILPPAPKLTIM